MVYKIIGHTNPYIAQRDIHFNGNTTITIESGLTLKEAQKRLLQFFNEDYGTSFSNWGLVRCSHPFEASTHKDGTRSYEYDSRYYSIKECEDIYDLCIDNDIDDCEKLITQEYGSCTFIDEKIDDGLDDGDYLMMRSYQVGDMYVRLYYPQTTRIVTDVNIN